MVPRYIIIFKCLRCISHSKREKTFSYPIEALVSTSEHLSKILVEIYREFTNLRAFALIGSSAGVARIIIVQSNENTPNSHIKSRNHANSSTYAPFALLETCENVSP